MIEQVSFDFDSVQEDEVISVDIEEKANKRAKRLEVGDSVVVTAVPDVSLSIESQYYLQDFEGKKGTLVRINRQKVVSFEVEFSKGKYGIFYEHELSK